MISPISIAVAAIFLPIAAAIAAHLVARVPKYGNSLAKALCVSTSYATLLLVLALAYKVVEIGPAVDSILTISLPIGTVALSVYVDSLALIPTILSALFASLAQTFSIKYLSIENRYRHVSSTFNRAHSLMLIFLGSMVGACFSGNIVMILIFWEITSLCSYALVAFWQEDPICRAAAFKTLIITHIGTLGFLIGAVTIYPVVRMWEIHQWEPRLFVTSIVPTAMLLFFIGILPKAVQFPLHIWLPDATVAPTPLIAYVHSAGFLMALYALPRFFSQIFAPYINASTALPLQLNAFFGNVSVWNFSISFIGAVTLIIASVFGLLEGESKRLIAYCDISALGSVFMALGFGTPLGTIAGLFAMFTHVFFSGLLFLVVGAAIYRLGRTSIHSMGGLYNYMPITVVCGGIGVLSLAGFPFLGYFTALWLIIHAAIELNAPVFVVLVFFGSILKTAAILRLLHAILLGKSPRYKKEIKEAPILMLFPMMLLSFCLFIFGVFPQLLLNSIILPAAYQLGMDVKLEASLGDIITASGFWNPALAATVALSYLSFMVGAVYVSSKNVVVRKTRIREEEALKPFLCGEDINLLEHVSSYHLYYTLNDVLRIDRICDALSVDRIYYALSRNFSKLCMNLLRLDIQQEYFPAVLSFIIGTIIIVLIAVLAG
ncbi:MAG: proton-conducting transporter membrane subunit [Candidatus Bathyarchaeia archaeon]